MSARALDLEAGTTGDDLPGRTPRPRRAARRCAASSWAMN